MKLNSSNSLDPSGSVVGDLSGNHQPLPPEIFDQYGLLHTLHRYWLLLRSRWKLVAVCPAAAAAVVFLLTNFVMTPKYQAQTLIRPTGDNASGLSSLIGGASGGSSSGGLLGGLMGMTGLTSGMNATHDPEEMKAIVESYGFTTSLLRDNNLVAKFTREREWWQLRKLLLKDETPSDWRLFRMMQHRFDCDFDYRTGNMSLTFIDPDPALARTVLGLYLDRLRSQLRRQDARDARLAAQSLEEEANKTPDVLLREQLYELVAAQVKREKTAEMAADFAFSVIEAPVVPDEQYAPWAGLDTIAAGFLTFLFSAAYVILRERWTHIKELALAESARPPAAPTPEQEHAIQL